MKKYLKLIVLLLPLAFFGCKDSDDPDPRQPFAGTYELEDFDVTFAEGSNDTTVTVQTNPEIEFEIDDNLRVDEMQADIEEFVEDAVIETLVLALGGDPSGVSIQFEDDGIAGINDSEFSIEDFDFTLMVEGSLYPCELNAEGELTEGELSFDFDILLFPGSSISFSGSATGELD